jgi:hypothetical protein
MQVEHGESGRHDLLNADGESVTDHEWVQVVGNKTIMDLEGIRHCMVTMSAGQTSVRCYARKGAQPGQDNGAVRI